MGALRPRRSVSGSPEQGQALVLVLFLQKRNSLPVPGPVEGVEVCAVEACAGVDPTSGAAPGRPVVKARLFP